MLQKKIRTKIFAIAWLLFISILFFLPGSALPKEGLFGVSHLDKLVHVVFFAILVFLWRFYFAEPLKFTMLLLILAVCYGLGVEMIQHYFIANRSFDVGDVIADAIGAIAGLLFWTKRYIKK